MPNKFHQFSKLPTELKVNIYEHHLTLSNKICPRPWGNSEWRLSSFWVHVRNCPLNEHDVVIQHNSPQMYTCEVPFEVDKTVYYRLTPSRLSLLLASREVLQMAVDIFYRRNHFVFDCKHKMTHMREFLDGIGDRRRFLSELSFQYAYPLADSVFKDLSKLQFLTKVHIVMNVESVPYSLFSGSKREGGLSNLWRTLRHAPGVASLLKIDNLEVLEISGRDSIKDGSQFGKVVDINHKDAIGPQMMRSMLSNSAYVRQFGAEQGSIVSSSTYGRG